MSTLRATNIKHELSATNQIVLGSDGSIGGTLGDTLAAKLDSADYEPGLDFVVRQSFTDVSSLSLNGCFTSDYANYRLIFRASANTGTPNIRFRLRASSSDNSDAKYNYVHLTSDTSVTAAKGDNQTSGYLSAISTSAVDVWASDFFGPAVATRTIMVGQGNFSNKIIIRTADHNVASAFDGITVYPETGTMSGSISVFGYADA